MRCCIALIAVLTIATSVSAQTTLRWKFEKDQHYAVHCTQQTEVETSVNNKPRRAYLEMTMDLDCQIDEVDDQGMATIAQSFTRLQLKSTAPDTDPVIYDSASAGKPTGAAREVAAGIAPLIGAKFIVTMNPRGDAVKVTLPDETQRVVDALPEGNQLKQLLSAKGLSNLFRLGGGQLPAGEVKPGDSWPADSETATPYGTLKQTGTFTYASAQDEATRKLAKIELASSAKLEPKADAQAKLNVQEQTLAGTLLFDVEAGHVVSSETKLASKSVRPFRDTQIQVKISSATKLDITRK